MLPRNSNTSINAEKSYSLPLSVFVRQHLLANNWYTIAEKLFLGSSLDELERLRLVTEMPLAELGTLVSLYRKKSDILHKYYFKLLVPVSATSTKLMHQEIKQVLVDSNPALNQYIAARYTKPEIFIKPTNTLDGPELIKFVQRINELQYESFHYLDFYPFGFNSIDIEQPVLPSHIDLNANLWGTKFCEYIDFLSEFALDQSRELCWSPKPQLAGANALQQPLGVQLLRCIALGRLLLPSVVKVTAPSSIFDSAMLSLALNFGADEFGYVALDEASAKRLSVPSIDSLSKLLFLDTASEAN